nr:hypothetical protein [uncultured Arsenicibacter sp.]
MGHYQATATNSRNVTLTTDGSKAGELIYEKWYSFKAHILMHDGTTYYLEPKGFWDSTIQLKHSNQVLAEFSMGWKGIIINTFFNNREDRFLLQLKGLLSSKFMLVNTDNVTVLAAETDFKWSKLTFDYSIETSPEFDGFDDKELLVLTVLHCINYYITMAAS